MLIGERTLDTAMHVRRGSLSMCAPTFLYTAVAARPRERRCRSGAPGQGSLREGHRAAEGRHRAAARRLRKPAGAPAGTGCL